LQHLLVPETPAGCCAADFISRMSASAVCAKADRRAKNAIIVKVCKFENEGEKKSCGEMCNNIQNLNKYPVKILFIHNKHNREGFISTITNLNIDGTPITSRS